MMEKKAKTMPELLAPAGNEEAFYGAIYAGADAVYLAGEQFGARAYAENFSNEALLRALFYAHLFDRKVYLTVNTLFREEELQELPAFLAPLYAAGLDGVIVQDLGVFHLIKTLFPDLPLHASTQLNITGPYGAAFAKSLGVLRAVPARELNLKELETLRQKSGLDLETFIHGAMCYCYSGQCLFSSVLGGRSGNRGRCAGPCRLPYQVEGQKKPCYPLSLKDLSALNTLPLLMERIDAFKIEGRMKKPVYAAGVTAIYRKYMDKFAKEGLASFHIEPSDGALLASLYIRSERSEGYFQQQNGRQMISLSSPAYAPSQEEVLKEIEEKYLNKRLKKPIVLSCSLQVGQRAWLELALEEIKVRVLGEEVLPAKKSPLTKEEVEKQLSKLGDTYFSAAKITLFLADNAFYPVGKLNALRREAVAALEAALREKYGRKNSQNLCTQEGTAATSAAASVAPAAGAAPAPAEIMPAAAFCDASVAASAHAAAATATESAPASAVAPVATPATPGFCISLRTPAQLQALADFGKEKPLPIRRLYIPYALAKGLAQDNGLVFLLQTYPCYLSLPEVLRAKDESLLKDALDLLQAPDSFWQGVQAKNLEAFGFFEKERIPLATDAALYVWNTAAAALLGKRARTLCLPYEQRGAANAALAKAMPNQAFEKVLYGRLPMMVSANCLQKTTDKCLKEAKSASSKTILCLTDRTHTKFPVELCCENCYNVIYNALPLSLHAKSHALPDNVTGRLDFTVEEGEALKEVLHFFLDTLPADPKAVPPYAYTTGHEKKGAL